MGEGWDGGVGWGNPRNHAGGRHLSLDAAASQLTRHGCYFLARVNLFTPETPPFSFFPGLLFYWPTAAPAPRSLSRPVVRV